VRIAQVVTYISPDGAFGGPVTVAAGQCGALAERGHDVTLFAAAPVAEPESKIIDGYTQWLLPAATLIPKTGFAGLKAKGLGKRLKLEGKFDVAHIHMARDLVTLPAAQYFQRAGTATVLQTHGMIDRSNRVLARALDLVATRRILSRAHAVLSLTAIEDEELSCIAPNAKVQRIGNGIKLADLPPYEGRSNEVIFMARLHPRKRALAFVEMAKLLLQKLPEFDFILYGPDEGEGKHVEATIAAAGAERRIRWLGAADPAEVPRLLRNARVFVLPSFGEVFPMTMLESFVAGTPTICTDSLGIAEDVSRYGAAIITDGDPQSLADAVESVLDGRAQDLREGALRYLQGELDVLNVVRRLETIYVGGAAH